ncbi:hypothetical protein RN001_000045 [Aquatica leii]|uniref:Beta-hexosaminidase n=1 Tax=Aquatica leii TaxID=1421715 RepID=A0AAN7Q2K3_9COLE|nr:hypothetical protein RN001_000045 [Aquatica leii]
MFRYHKFIMKPAGLKKILYFLLLMCGVLIFYLMRYQFSPLSNLSLRLTNKQDDPDHNPAQTEKQPDVWTWRCENEKCIRYQRNRKEPEVSLATCNMLCGSMQLWPKPTGLVSLGTRTISFTVDQIVLETEFVGALEKLVKSAFSCFKENVAKLCGKSDSKNSDINSFKINVNVIKTNVTKLHFDTDESYSLTLKTIKTDLVVIIKATTFFGARHGFETLSQLIWWDEYTHGGTLKVLKGALINDSPMFSYRGLMLDTARNFIPVVKIKKVLVGMAANKLNVFHWHITDSQSFPFRSIRVPKMSAFGAYGRDMVYHPDDIKDIVNYALVRGIRVVIEIDTPAHAGNGWNWGPSEGLGELAVCVNEQPWSAYCGEPPCGQLNPINPNTYDVLEKLYKDIIELTKEDEIFHLGGDEVNLECWSRKLKWNNDTGYYSDLHDLWGKFTVEALQRLKKANGGKLPKHVVMWSSNLSKKPYTTKYLNKNNIVIQVWGPLQWGEGVDLLREGYRLILSHVDAWYLDCGFGRWREMGEAACDPYRTWQSVYMHRPWQILGTNRHNILGGEACLWSEQVDLDSVEARLWPRAAAFAERVWNDPPFDAYAAVGVAEDVYTRLNTQRDRLISRGLVAEAMWPQWCSQNPGMCL